MCAQKGNLRASLKSQTNRKKLGKLYIIFAFLHNCRNLDFNLPHLTPVWLFDTPGLPVASKYYTPSATLPCRLKGETNIRVNRKKLLLMTLIDEILRSATSLCGMLYARLRSLIWVQQLPCAETPTNHRHVVCQSAAGDSVHLRSNFPRISRVYVLQITARSVSVVRILVSQPHILTTDALCCVYVVKPPASLLYCVRYAAANLQYVYITVWISASTTHKRRRTNSAQK